MQTLETAQSVAGHSAISASPQSHFVDGCSLWRFEIRVVSESMPVTSMPRDDRYRDTRPPPHPMSRTEELAGMLSNILRCFSLRNHFFSQYWDDSPYSTDIWLLFAFPAVLSGAPSSSKLDFYSGWRGRAPSHGGNFLMRTEAVSGPLLFLFLFLLFGHSKILLYFSHFSLFFFFVGFHIPMVTTKPLLERRSANTLA